MTKQEFLAASLPYDLQVYNEKGVQKTYAALHYSYEFEPEFEKFTPILRPLSDLIKEIEHKGEKFVPLVEINKRNEYIHAINGRIGIGIPIFGYRDVDDMDELPTWLTQFLVKLHFDITDLISKGEAIDVNTLDINPYK